MKEDTHYEEAITRVYITLLLTVFLFFCSKSGFEGIVGAKHIAFMIVSGGYVAVMLLFRIERILIGNLKARSPKAILRSTSWAQRLMIIYLLITWTSATHSEYWPFTIIGTGRYEGALAITIYVLSFLLVSAYVKLSKSLVWIFGISTTVFCVICILQFLGLNPLWLYPKGIGYADAYVEYSGAFLGTIGNVDLVAAYFSVVIPVLLTLIFALPHKQKYLLLVPLLLSVAVLVKMHVLAGFVGVAAGCAAAAFILLARSRSRQKMGLIIMACLLILCLGVVYAVDFDGGMFYEAHEILHGNVDDSFGTGRVHIWKEVLERAKEHPLLGTGPDTMRYGDLEGFQRYDERLEKLLVSKIDVAHNEYLNVYYHQGIFAALAYLAAIVLLVRRWMLASAESKEAMVAGTGMIGYAIQALFGFSMCITAPFFWLCAGIVEHGMHSEKVVSLSKTRKEGKKN